MAKPRKKHDLNDLNTHVLDLYNKPIYSSVNGSVREETERYRFLLNAAISRYRPFIISDKIAEIVRDRMMILDEQEIIEVDVKKINLPFDTMIISSDEPNHCLNTHLTNDFETREEAENYLKELNENDWRGAGKYLGTQFFLIRYDEKNLDIFRSETPLGNPLEYQGPKEFIGQYTTSHSRFTYGQSTKDEVAIECFTYLKTLSDLVTENVLYKDENPRYMYHQNGRTREKRCLDQVIYLKCPREVKIAKERNTREPGSRCYDFRFEVMGHWRRICGTGKDSLGSRNQKNRTWVEAHIKGPTNAPLLRQLRHVELGYGSTV